ncbi:hypothetical protein PtA15_11A214 [Puccinia triticina]|uniref:Uncharacterized protein n=1 Tax=Puccinia triticina TaxID=208348 RepID=A0ABY7D0G3_9BASI|nr:uncharacterized protein PtA15_11A214 [Puccinia triticina]WAQ89525.1 hypothetical protein PtA15_11A214 [Puccinia triticina]
MDPHAAAESSTIMALIRRWFNGRRDDLHREERKPGSAESQKRLIRKSRLRKTLSKNRTETLQRLNVDEKFQGIFSDPQCNSDTEDLENGKQVKVKLAWRSKIADSLAEKIDMLTVQRKEETSRKAFGPGQLLENRRQNSDSNSTVSQAKIPRCLPRDWYDKQLLQDLGKSAREHLSDQAPLGLSDLCFHLDQLISSQQ